MVFYSTEKSSTFEGVTKTVLSLFNVSDHNDQSSSYFLQDFQEILWKNLNEIKTMIYSAQLKKQTGCEKRR